jgi:molecular chaperone Hsp33
MQDHLIIATTSNDTVRIYAALTTRLVEEARLLHGTWPTATAAFGRALTGTLMMGVMSDNPYRLTVDISGSGPVGKILAVSNERGTVKGEIFNPEVDLDLNQFGKLDVAGAIGEGYLSVIKDYGLKDPYRGIVPIISGEIARDFAYYFTKSEQTPSAVALGVLVSPGGKVGAAGGLIIQLMPGASEETTGLFEEKLASLPSLTSLLSQGISPLEIIGKVVADPGAVKVLEEVPVAYRCDCTRDRFRGPLLSLDRDELGTILKEQGRIEVRCHFCNKLYHYQSAELTE